jgi:hypothetical protein
VLTVKRALLAGLLAALAASPAMGRITGDIESVGYRTGPDVGGRGAGVRVGSWVPITVSLALDGESSFDGELRVEQRDSDGDFCYDARPVYLTSDAGFQFFELYAVVGAGGAPAITVSLYDKSGRVVPMVSGGQMVTRLAPSFSVETIPDREPVVVYVAPVEWTLGKVDSLRKAERLRASVHLVNRSPGQLPSRWIGLEMVDHVIWDRADVTELTAAQQIALVEWVRQGGTLLIASAARADTLARSDVFEPLLPVRLGNVVRTEDLPRFRRQLLKAGPEGMEGIGYRDGISVVQATLRDAPFVEAILEEGLPGADAAGPASTVLISSRGVGRGRVIFVGATVRDLLEPPGNPESFLAAVLGLRTPSIQTDQNVSTYPLFPYLQEVVGFQATGASYLALAFLMALIYLFGSTFGSWAFLKSRGWLQHNWAVFAALAILASLLSVSAVQAVRGVGQKLHQLSIVDLSVGSAEAVATCHFGLKTGLHSEVDVWLPDDYASATESPDVRSYLRPMIEMTGNLSDSQSWFTDPTEYRLRPASAKLDDVPVRATLKRLEGRWSGTITGSVQASIRVSRKKEIVEESLTGDDSRTVTVDEITSESTLTNNLGVDLYDCYLLQAEVDAFDRDLSFLCRSPRGQKATVRGTAFVHPLGTIRDGETIRVADRITKDSAGRPVRARDWVDGNSMFRWHERWGKPFESLGFATGLQTASPRNVRRDFQKALLLLTTLEEYYPGTLNVSQWNAGLELLPDRCRELDLSDRLTRNAMVLVGFTNDAGPVKLCTRTGSGKYERLMPTEAWTMYRVMIPVP